MKNSLVQKSKAGIGIITAITAGVLLSSNTLDAYAQTAQTKKFPKNHDYGASLQIDKGTSKYSLEEKVLYGDRFYFHRLEQKNEDELGLAALDVHTSQTIVNSLTKEIEEVKADKQYIYKKVKLDDGSYANKIKITGVRAAGWCDNQIKEKANASKDVSSYIIQTDIQDLIPNIQILKLRDGKKFYYPSVTDKQLNEKGKTNHYLIPLETAKIGLNQADKSITIYGDIYRGYEKEGIVTIKTSSGKASELGIDTSFVKKETEPKEELKEPKTLSPYLIIGGDGNYKFLEGELGVQYGPLALVANYGRAKNENILDAVTAPSTNGRYAEMKEKNVDMGVIGGSAELHLFNNKKLSLYIAGGVNHWTYTTEKEINIMKEGQLLKPNTSSKANSENSWKTYGGINFPVRKSKIGLQAGYDSKAKFFGGIRYSIKLGK